METQIQEYSKTEAALAELRERYQGAEYDVQDPEGEKQAREARREIKQYRVDLEKTRKAIKAPALEYCRLIDSEAKRITGELVKLEDPIDAQIKAEEERKEAERQAKIEAERERVQAIKGRIGWYPAQVDKCRRASLASADIEVLLESVCADEPFEEDYQEFLEEAVRAQADARRELTEYLEAAQAREAESARIEAERKALEAERERERQEREAREAEEKAKRQAELEKQRQEDERLAEERRKFEEERRAFEAEKAKQAEAERREREKALAQERRKQELKAEQDRKAKLAAEKRNYPGGQAIVAALCEHFDVETGVAIAWLKEYCKS